jgi:hypothetical protein
VLLIKAASSSSLLLADREGEREQFSGAAAQQRRSTQQQHNSKSIVSPPALTICTEIEDAIAQKEERECFYERLDFLPPPFLLGPSSQAVPSTCNLKTFLASPR